MKYYRMTVNSKAVPVMRAAVYAKPGQAARDLCAGAGYTYAHGVAVLTILRKAGEVAPVRADGGKTLWFPADQAAEQKAKWAAIRKEHEKARKARNRKAKPSTRADRISMTSPAVLKVLKVITENPGIQSGKMAELTGCARSHVKNVLTVIRASGRAVVIPAGARDRHWYLTEVAGPHIEQWQANRRDRTMPADRAPTKRDRIAALAAGPEGVRMSVIMADLGIAQNLAGRHVLKMVEQGRIFKADRAGARLRWFDTADKAQQWAAMPPMEPSEWSEPRRQAWANDALRAQRFEIRQANRIARQMAQKAKAAEREQAKTNKPKPQKARKSSVYAAIKANPAMPAPVEIRTKSSSANGPVDYSKAKLTVCPSPGYDARYQLPPGAQVQGEFSRQWQELRGAA